MLARCDEQAAFASVASHVRNVEWLLPDVHGDTARVGGIGDEDVTMPGLLSERDAMAVGLEHGGIYPSVDDGAVVQLYQPQLRALAAGEQNGGNAT